MEIPEASISCYALSASFLAPIPKEKSAPGQLPTFRRAEYRFIFALRRAAHRENQIMRTFILALVAVVPAFAVGQAWCADDLPAFDIFQNCKAEAAGSGTAVEDCTIDETNAKNELAKSWSSYSASAKKDCIGEASIGGDKSYVELLTCLEMTTGKLEKQ